MQVTPTAAFTTNSSNAGASALPQIATGFVRKLYRILDQESGPVISWTRGGAAFMIFDAERLNELILPRYFRGRLCAFRQQLREHGFRELLAAGGSVPIAPVAPHPPLPATYFHEHFVRGSPGRLAQIPRTPLPRRRVSSRKGKASSASSSTASSAAKRAAVAVAAATATVARAKAKETSSHKRARVGSASSTSSAPSASTSTTAASRSSASSSSSSTSPRSPSSSSTASASSSGVRRSCPSLVVAPVAAFPQPSLQPPLLQSLQQPTAKRKNPLFSDESDSVWGGDWLSLDDISPPGATLSTAGVSTDITFSEDMLGALMTLVSNSMSATMAPSPTSTCASAVACGAKLSSVAASGVPGALPLCGVAKRAGVVASGGGPTVYETHQFSDDTINSMMLWLGGGGSA